MTSRKLEDFFLLLLTIVMVRSVQEFFIRTLLLVRQTDKDFTHTRANLHKKRGDMVGNTIEALASIRELLEAKQNIKRSFISRRARSAQLVKKRYVELIRSLRSLKSPEGNVTL